MYVGITRARRTLVVSTLRRRKRGRETVAGVPSRFIAEMKLRRSRAKEDPRERLRNAARRTGRARRGRRPRPTEPSWTRDVRLTAGSAVAAALCAALAIVSAPWALGCARR